jgi:hypothetical protein
MSAPAVSILDAIGDPELFAPWFKRPESWQSWFAFLKTLFGLPMGEADVATFRACTGREGLRPAIARVGCVWGAEAGSLWCWRRWRRS